MSALDLHDVTVTYPDGNERITALDAVSITVEAGELAFLIGESGSGKSTLLSVAAGLIRPDRGTVTVEGQPVDTRVRLHRIGMIFQQPNLIGALTVRDQLLVTDHIRGRTGARLAAARGRADDLLAAVGLAGLGDRRMAQLSGGQRQRVNIARALMGSPAVLLADEPTSALDSERSAEIAGLLRGLTRELDVACVFVTHDSSLIEPGDRVIAVRDGRIITREED